MCMQIYGESMSKRPDVTTFYHGISDTLLFNSTRVNLYGPVSTTGGMFLCLLFSLHFLILYLVLSLFLSQIS